MAKTIYNTFRTPFTYAAGIEDWCKQAYGHTMEYTFCSDFALADWVSEDNVNKLYKEVIKSWGDDYKAFTEIVISINMLAWANNQLVKQGITGRDKFVEFYSELYYKAKDDFYNKFEHNSEATSYFFEMTD